jgi:hypothetical protein
MAVVDRLRTWLITNAMWRMLPTRGSFRILDIGCGAFACKRLSSVASALRDQVGTIDLFAAEQDIRDPLER